MALAEFHMLFWSLEKEWFERKSQGCGTDSRGSNALHSSDRSYLRAMPPYMRYHERRDSTPYNVAFAYSDNEVRPPGYNSQARSSSPPLSRHPPIRLRCPYVQAQTFLLRSCSTLRRFVIRNRTMLRRTLIFWLLAWGQLQDLSSCQVCFL